MSHSKRRQSGVSSGWRGLAVMRFSFPSQPLLCVAGLCALWVGGARWLAALLQSEGRGAEAGKLLCHPTPICQWLKLGGAHLGHRGFSLFASPCRKSNLGDVPTAINTHHSFWISILKTWKPLVSKLPIRDQFWDSEFCHCGLSVIFNHSKSSSIRKCSAGIENTPWKCVK